MCCSLLHIAMVPIKQVLNFMFTYMTTVARVIFRGQAFNRHFMTWPGFLHGFGSCGTQVAESRCPDGLSRRSVSGYKTDACPSVG